MDEFDEFVGAVICIHLLVGGMYWLIVHAPVLVLGLVIRFLGL